jgi:molybdopterin converting factor subunit 1
MTLTVHLFAKLRDLAGADAVALSLPDGATVADLRRALAEQHPSLAALLARSAVAVNHDFAPDTVAVPPGSEVAIIPPVSGG